MVDMQEEYLANDEEVVGAKEKKIKNARDQELSDIREVLKTPEGVRLMRKLLADGKLFHTSFTGSSQTFFNEGWRAFGLKIMSDISEAAPLKLSEILIVNEKEGKK